MSSETPIHDSIERAADVVGPAWPLHSFVTANPLAGFEDESFHDAVERASELFGARGYPSADTFRTAWEDGRIDPEVLSSKLAEHGYEDDPEALLDRMEAEAEETAETADDSGSEEVDRLLTKWLAAFLDEGHAQWPMPDREEGFYDAFRATAHHDGEIPDAERIAELPDRPVDAIEEVLKEYPIGRWEDIFEHHLSALPGWTAFIKRRANGEESWQSAHPITLEGYLAVRLTLADLLDAPIEPTPDDSPTDDPSEDDGVPLPEVWLRAWEATYREQLVDTVADESESLSEDDGDERPDAQLVFCIDTRSEVIRRHVEAAGNYETHGYAGFFGVPMRYEGYDSDVAVDACPPIVDAQHRVTDRPTGDADGERDAHDRWSGLVDAGKSLVKSLKSNAATVFSYVESTGSAYGLALAARTLLPAGVYDLQDAVDDAVPSHHEFCEPSVDYNPDAVTALREGLTLEEKVEYAEAAFELMGWEQFARVVAFVGHASETTNNPFDSSLDCGACAGNPGGPSARVLAAICNDEDVKAELRERGFDVPEDTVFVAGEHNTTTDEVTLFDADVPDSHEADLKALREDLETARAGATAERAESMDAGEDSGVRETERRAADWAETRPEWGLAGNAAFVVGPHELTSDVDFDGRAFLHSYDWTTDPDGEALEEIVAGPMVVTQWISSQYYFATVDNAVYGSGSKVTHNPVGNVGVYQGNGGDLMTGLPQQSLYAAADEPYHQPLRLSTVVHAPVERVTDVLADAEQVRELLDNGWLSLTVVDPEQDHRTFHYEGDLEWEPLAAERAEPPQASVGTPADD